MFDKISNIFHKKNTFQAYLSVEKIGGRRFVIPDIHGCHQTFSKLLEEVNLTKNDQLFLLGDYISRGESSAKVLDVIIDLQKKKYQVYALRGNHEQMALDYAKKRSHELIWLADKLEFQDLLASKSKLKYKYESFMNKLPFYIELEDYLLVHAGFDFSKHSPFNFYDAMLWTEKATYHTEKAKNKIIIHGHKTRPLFQIENDIAKNKKIIGLDNGCVYLGKKPQRGYLLCYNLDDKILIKQKKLEV